MRGDTSVSVGFLKGAEFVGVVEVVEVVETNSGESIPAVGLEIPPTHPFFGFRQSEIS